MASAITRAAAAAALRRTAVIGRTAGPHRAAPLEPPFPRFGRPRYCYRARGPPDEQVAEPTMEELELMDKKTLLQYAKGVTLDKQALLKRGCRYSVESDVTMQHMKQSITEMSSRMDVLHKSVEKKKDLTSISIGNVGSINLLAVGIGCLTIYQAWVQFS